jgi:hypothetical protein
MRVLVLSTVFPNARRPTYGTFVRDRVRHLAAHCDVQVVAPIPWFPPQRWWRDQERAAAPAVEVQFGMPVYHPRVISVPAIAKSLDGLFYFLSLLRFLRRLRQRRVERAMDVSAFEAAQRTDPPKGFLDRPATRKAHFRACARRRLVTPIRHTAVLPLAAPQS